MAKAVKAKVKTKRRWAPFFISVFLLMGVCFGAVLVYIDVALPDISVLKDAHMQEPLRVYSADGKLIAEYGIKRRSPVDISQIPKPLIQALLATEDARFYSHPGVDPIGIVRAAIAVLTTGRKVEGASTITMQVARNFFLDPKKTYKRKIKEILLAIKIDHEFSKDKILELYFNKVYFGNRAYGVSAAAHVYYGKTLDQLTLPEMAMLAGLPQSPSRNNPINNPKGALIRRNHVLQRMYEQGYITKAEYEKAILTPLTARYHGRAIQLRAPYVAEMARQVAVSMYGEKAYESGFNIYTTIESNLQNASTNALQNGLMTYAKNHQALDKNGAPKVEGAMVVMNPQTGAVLALNGGYDFNGSAFNRVLQAQRQPGSSFKPFLYTAALAKGYTLSSVINDAPIMIRDTGENAWWRPENDTKEFYGPTRLRVALSKSQNLVSIRLLRSIGIPYAIDYLKRFGFDASKLPNSLSLALGSGVVTPMQLTTAYAVIASGGHKIAPFFIDKITGENNQVLFQMKTQEGPQVVSPQHAYLITQALKSVVTSGTARDALSLHRDDIAGKTGTTNDQVDAWFVGFNRNVLATVWVGYDNSEKSLHVYGAQVALPIWINFMKTALQGQPLASMPQPPGIITARIDKSTGLLANAGDHDTMFEVFDQNAMPVQMASQDHDTSAHASGGAGAHRVSAADIF